MGKATSRREANYEWLRLEYNVFLRKTEQDAKNEKAHFPDESNGHMVHKFTQWYLTIDFLFTNEQ